MKKKILTMALAFSMTVSQIPLTTEAAVTKEMTEVSVNGINYYYIDIFGLENASEASFVMGDTQKSLSELANIENTSIYYAIAEGSTAIEGKVYGTTTLSYTEYYAGDTSVEQYDAISSATTSKNTIFPNEDSTVPTDSGYLILGVKNVPVAVEARIYSESKILAAANALPETGIYSEAAAITLNENYTQVVPQYKTLESNGTYSATKSNVVAEVNDAEIVLKTTSNWGAYEIDVLETSTSHIRNSRDDNFDINSQIQGLILETTDGIKVGMRYTEEIWVQPYEVAFNLGTVAADKLTGKTVNKVTFIMPDSTYIYSFENGVYIKPQMSENSTFTAIFGNDLNTVQVDVSGLPKDLQNPKVTVYHKEGKKTTYYAQNVEIVNGKVTLSTPVSPNTAYKVVVSSDNYADESVSINSPLVNIENMEATISENSFTYDGNAKKPTVIVNELTEGTDYTVEYVNNVNVGTAKVIIKGIGNYSGTITKTFEIVKKVETPTKGTEKATQKTEKPTQETKENTVNATVPKVKKLKVTSKSKKKIKVTWKKNTNVSGYQIQYSTNKKFKKAKKINIKKGTKASTTISKLISKKKYYVRIRAYKKVAGKNKYGSWSAKKYVKVK